MGDSRIDAVMSAHADGWPDISSGFTVVVHIISYGVRFELGEAES